LIARLFPGFNAKDRRALYTFPRQAEAGWNQPIDPARLSERRCHFPFPTSAAWNFALSQNPSRCHLLVRHGRSRALCGYGL